MFDISYFRAMLSQVSRLVPRLQQPRLALSSFRLYSSAGPGQIEIPARVERGPTDILEALAGTVGKDFTAPHYRYHDDPWLIPYKLDNKRAYTLSKESGRKAAKFIMNQHPDLFEHNRIEADPPATAFQPRVRYNRDNVTLELLQNLGQFPHLPPSGSASYYNLVTFSEQFPSGGQYVRVSVVEREEEKNPCGAV